MRTETAISLVGVVMDALFHREVCTRNLQDSVPSELLEQAFATLEAIGRDTSQVRAFFSAHGVKVPLLPTQNYCRRANNQVSQKTEELIRELLNEGYSKVAISKSMRVNRRVVIRVAREAQSAHGGYVDKG